MARTSVPVHTTLRPKSLLARCRRPWTGWLQVVAAAMMILSPLPSGLANWSDTDSDGNNDTWTDPQTSQVTTLADLNLQNNDADNDGATNDEEAAEGTNPFAYDTDLDGLSDGDELHYVKPSLGVSLTDWDSDDDEVSDHDEWYGFSGVTYPGGQLPSFPGASYSDYDGDGIKNHEDPYPSDPDNGSTTDGDGDGIMDAYDPYPGDNANYSDANGVSWYGEVLNDADSDGTPNWQDSEPYGPPPPGDPDPDSDGDGYSDPIDPFPSDNTNYSEINGIAWYNDVGADADSDGTLNWQDVYPYVSSADDPDNDGIANTDDPFPNDGANYSATNNIYWNGEVLWDADADGVLNWQDPYPQDNTNYSFANSTAWYGDVLGDMDNDGTPNWQDSYPSDPYNGTGTTNPDTDGDGFADSTDPFPNDASNYSSTNGITWNGDVFGDADSDGTLNWEDTTPYPDSDGDGVFDPNDPYPSDASNYSSNNGVYWYGDVLGDADGDGTVNWQDSEPYGPASADTDADGIDDASDPFPNDYSNYSSYNGYMWYAEVLWDADSDGTLNWQDPWPHDPMNGWTPPPDNDGDGLDESAEATYGTSDYDVDCDDDGLSDYEELMVYYTNPLSAYHLSQGLGWGDLYTDYQLVDGTDSDADGIPDRIEEHYGMLPNDPADGAGDLDGNGLSNLVQYNAGWALNVDLNFYDADGDGMTDVFEDYYSLDRNNFADAMGDADNDGVLNFEESKLLLSPVHADTEARGGLGDLAVLMEAMLYPEGGAPTDDSDGDVIPDWQEAALANGSPIFTRAAVNDLDGDGMPDVWEHQHGRWKYPTLGLYVRHADPSMDPDEDGLGNLQEWLTSLHPLISDSDGNGTLDGDEDTDADGLTNFQETAIGSNAAASDTDGDGYNDYDEHQAGSDTQNGQSTPLDPDGDGQPLDPDVVPGVFLMSRFSTVQLLYSQGTSGYWDDILLSEHSSDTLEEHEAYLAANAPPGDPDNPQHGTYTYAIHKQDGYPPVLDGDGQEMAPGLPWIAELREHRFINGQSESEDYIWWHSHMTTSQRMVSPERFWELIMNGDDYLNWGNIESILAFTELGSQARSTFPPATGSGVTAEPYKPSKSLGAGLAISEPSTIVPGDNPDVSKFGTGTWNQFWLVRPVPQGLSPEQMPLKPRREFHYLKVTKKLVEAGDQEGDGEEGSDQQTQSEIIEKRVVTFVIPEGQDVSNVITLAPSMVPGAKRVSAEMTPLIIAPHPILSDGTVSTMTSPLETSMPSPIVDVSSCTVANVRLDSQGNLTGDVTLNGSIKSQVCDTVAGTAGEIDEAQLFVNDAGIPHGLISISSTKESDGPVGRPYPYSGSFMQTLQDVPLVEGTNIFQVTARDKIYGMPGYAKFSTVVTVAATDDEGGAIGGQSHLSLSVQLPPIQDLAAASEVTVSHETDEGSVTNVTFERVSGSPDVRFGATVNGEYQLLELASGTAFSAGERDEIVGVLHLSEADSNGLQVTLRETAPASLVFAGGYQTYPGVSNDPESPEDPDPAPEDPEAPIGGVMVEQPYMIEQSNGGEFYGYALSLTLPEGMDTDGGVSVVMDGQTFKVKKDETSGLALLHNPQDESKPVVVSARPPDTSAPPPSAEEQKLLAELKDASFAEGFAKGMGAGGVELVAGTVEVVKGYAEYAGRGLLVFGCHIHLLGQGILGMDQEATYDFMFEIGEPNLQVHEEIASMVKMLTPVAEWALANVENTIALEVGLLTGNIEGIASASIRGGELNGALFMMGAEAISNTLKEYEQAPPGVKGYKTGRVVFELACLLIPLTKAGRIAELKKAEILQQLLTKNVLGPNTTTKITALRAALETTKMCFVAGTKVHAKGGLKNIEDIQPGDLVWSKDQFTGETGWRPVVETFVTHPSEIYHLTYVVRGPPTGDSAEGQTPILKRKTMGTTAPHPFWVLNRSKPAFVPAENLKIGDRLLLAIGGIAEVEKLEIEHAISDIDFTTYNFEVADFHTYFVGELGVWVHNSGDSECERVFGVYTWMAKKLGDGKHVEAYFETLRKMPNMTRRLQYKTYREVVNDFLAKGGRPKNPPDIVSTPDGDVDIKSTIERIYRGDTHPHRRDTAVHQNREGHLPAKPEGYYREYVVPTPGISHAGLRRIVEGLNGELYYSHRHYEDFVLLN